MHEGRIYNLRLTCDKDYPRRPPQVRFTSKINMGCVNQRDGNVQLSILTSWNPNTTIENILLELRKEMASAANKKLPQPAEGTTF